MANDKSISSNYLFHFTKNIKNLSNIMNNYFMPFYCLEKLSFLPEIDKITNDYFEMAFPLVCFCDIPEQSQNKHRSKFGEYGIALHKQWGMKNLLTPILYTYEDAIPVKNLKYLIEFFRKEKDKFEESTHQEYNNHISYLLMHYKSYEGYFYLKGKKKFSKKKRIFYDEREWRHIPSYCDNIDLCLSRKDFQNNRILKEKNKLIQLNNKLAFSVDDIKYIYLNENNEISPFLQSISGKYTKSELIKIQKRIKINKKTCP